MTNKLNFSNFFKLISAPLFMLLLVTGCQDKEREMEETELRLDSLARELTQYKQTADSLKALIEKGDIAADYPIYFGKEYDSIEDPKEFIKNSLKNQPEKIPLNPVVGGTMEFRQVKVLTNDWVLGVYDDGHIQGKSIYQYRLQPTGEVHFTHITSTEPEE